MGYWTNKQNEESKKTRNLKNGCDIILVPADHMKEIWLFENKVKTTYSLENKSKQDVWNIIKKEHKGKTIYIDHDYSKGQIIKL